MAQLVEIPDPRGPQITQLFPTWTEAFEGISGNQERPPEEAMFELSWEDWTGIGLVTSERKGEDCKGNLVPLGTEGSRCG